MDLIYGLKHASPHSVLISKVKWESHPVGEWVNYEFTKLSGKIYGNRVKCSAN